MLSIQLDLVLKSCHDLCCHNKSSNTRLSVQHSTIKIISSTRHLNSFRNLWWTLSVSKSARCVSSISKHIYFESCNPLLISLNFDSKSVILTFKESYLLRFVAVFHYLFELIYYRVSVLCLLTCPSQHCPDHVPIPSLFILNSKARREP